VNCDWCGLPFAEGEKQYAGYDDEPTHKDCLRDARRAWAYDQRAGIDDTRPEREPFTDWPNGQGTYD